MFPYVDENFDRQKWIFVWSQRFSKNFWKENFYDTTTVVGSPSNLVTSSKKGMINNA